MKQSKFLVFIILFGVFACQQAPRTSYVINGQAKDMYDGLRVYLSEKDERGRTVSTDTAIIFNEQFTFEGAIEEPTVIELSVQTLNGKLPVMLENSAISITINKDFLQESKVTGSETDVVLKQYIAELKTLRDRLRGVTNQYRFNSSDTDLSSERNSQILELQKELREYPYNFIASNPKSFAVFPILATEAANKNVDFETLEASFNSLDASLKNSKQGVKFKQTIERLRTNYLRAKKTAIGAKAPEFKATTPDGEELALSDIYSKGKVTIVDFWAAWCGPCRRENPNVVRIYEKYHDKGLEILGVSLDGRRGQQDPKGAWMKAIDDDKLTWHHVSNLKYFGPIANLYGVRAIPAMFILDEEGKIIAKNLRGKALENKIAELLGS